MPISLGLALGLSVIYILLNYNRAVFEALYLNFVKIDVLGAIAIASWVFYLSSVVGTIFASIMSIITLCIILFGQYSMYITKRNREVQKNSGVINLDTTEDSIKHNDPMTMFNGKRGLIKGKISGNYYLGDINMGTDDSPSNQEILLYNEDGFNVGDTYEITHIDGSKIVAKKV